MKKAFALLLLAAGCSSSSKPADEAADLEFEKFVATQLAFDPALLRGGQRVLYTVKQQGSVVVEYFQWAAVAEDAGGIWIENKVPHPPTDMVKKYKMDRTGKLLEYWAGPPGGSPAKLYPKPGASEPPPVRRDSSAAQPKVKEEPDTLLIGGKAYACTKVTTELTYAGGRKSTMVNWMSKDVPFAGQLTHGGLVKRQFGRITMELVDYGAQGARPELAIPAK
jgi:hypothetical protein